MVKIKELLKQYKSILFIAVFIIVILLSWTLLHSYSDEVVDSGWDGVVARSFTSGTGTENNPYVISNASEFGYFKSLLEGEDANAYVNKNYVITNGFNYGEYDISINNEIPFSGTIDGNGNIIYNTSMSNALFNTVDNATIRNINFSDITYSLTNETGALLANDATNTNIDMLILSGKININVDSSFGGLIYTSNNNKYSNIVLNYDITSNSANIYKFIYESKTDDGNNILVNSDNYQNSKSELDFSINNYEFDNGNIKNIDKINLDNYVNDNYKINISDNKFIITSINQDTVEEKTEDDNKTEVNNNTPNKAPAKRSAVGSSTITEHASGADGNTFYINDLTSDKNYYKGLNFTEVRSTSIPSGVSTGYFDDNNLVKVEIIYDGKDINNSSLVGALSPLNSENTNKFVYFKYYALERTSSGALATNSDGDNYIRIELIDNPFSKRPYVNSTEYGFNGWVCNQENDTTTDLCENATFSFNVDNYTRYLEIPVNGGSEIILHLNASWYRADVVTSYYDISDFSQKTMQETFYTSTETVTHRYNAYWKQDYTQMEYVRSYNYNAGYLPANVWYRTNRSSGTYYYVSQANSVRADRWYGNTTLYVYNANTTAITEGTRYTGGSVKFVANFNATGNNTETTITTYNTAYMNVIEEANGTFSSSEQVTRYHSYLPSNANVSGFYYQVSNPTAQMIATGEYYNASGDVCTSTSACTTAYKLIQYNDTVTNSNGNSIYLTETSNNELVDARKYYYFVTRDMNIFRYTATGNNNRGLSIDYLEVNRPFTVTGVAVNGNTAAGILNTSNNFTASNDIVIENIRIYGPGSAGTDNTSLTTNNRSSYSIYANSHNLKIGHNVTSSRNSSYLVANTIMGGTTSSVSGTFRVIVESGFYYSYHSGVFSTSYYGSSDFTLNETTILGNDYDRIIETNNKLRFLVGLDGYADGSHTAGNDSLFASFTTVKSGMLGYNSDGTPNTDNTAGMYIGGRSSLCVESLTGAKIEGGQVNTVVGGYGYNGSTTTNSTYIGMSGGTVRSIYGGAGHSTTKGNRIINVTGGTVSYSVLGGSDSYSSTDTTDGVVQGSTLIYVGGNVTVGGGTGELNGVEAGSVFGAGGGNSNSTAKGTVYNSHVIINGGTINTSVYGGGNFGSTGTQYNGTASTVVDIYSGTIGSVYGGSKSAGFGKEAYEDTGKIDINITGGTIGNVYGGSNTKGDVYGSVDIDITGGTVTGNVYGGGQGSATVVYNDIDLTIGNSSTGPTISGSVYGGSAFGTVNSSDKGSVEITVNNGTITGSVFGGGQGSATETPYVNGDITVTVNDGTIGSVFGGNDQAGSHSKQNEVHLNGGTITNAYGGGNKSSVTNTNVYLDGAKVTNLYGGSNTSGDVSTTNVQITSGEVKNVYGGNNAGGTTGSTTVNIPGAAKITGNVYGGGQGAATVVNNDVSVTIGNSSTGPTISGSVYGGSAYGSVNSENSGNVEVTVNNGTITGSVFGGGQGSNTITPYVNGDITVTINGGDITSVFGGNDQAGSHTKLNEVYLNDGIIDEVYGGGNKSSVTTTHVYLQGSTVTNLYGGSNSLGDVTTSNVEIKSGTVQNIYGGNNEGGSCGTTNVNVQGTANVNGSIYGGGNEVDTTTTNVNLNSAGSSIANVYGGGNSASVGTSNVNHNGITVTNIYGGSNSSGTVTNSYVNQNNGTVTTIYGGNNAGGNTLTSHVNMAGGTSTTIYGGGNQANGDTSNINMTGGTVNTIFGGGNSAGLDQANVTVTNGVVTDIYGGSNTTGMVYETNITYDHSSGTVSNIYGGGNHAQVGYTNILFESGTVTNIYGGGNLAQATGDTTVDINGGTITTIYGGGNQGVVLGSSNVTITDANILGNAYAGGNGATATLEGNANITIDGNTVIGTSSSTAPNAGCVFGGGNQAMTGTQIANNSTSTVNIVGGTIYGNVYGGAKFAVIYGNTVVNIGQSAYTSESLKKDDIDIRGNIFGGGEANSSGSSDIYDWSFISVTEGVNITIDADTYDNFNIDGSFFGGGNASTASGDSYLMIRNYGTTGDPEFNISIQRVTYVTIDNSSILLAGAIDRANDYDKELFSISRVVRLKIKDNSEIYFKTGANLLEEFVSVDENDNKATVQIDTETNAITSKNVDNRIYVYEGKNINIAHDQQVEDYGNVSGMTFLGLFNFDNDNHVNNGIYNANYGPGDTLPVQGLFTKGSYVLGKHYTNHDIEVDGFYSNFMNGETSVNEINYINPIPEDSPFYMWYIGENAIEYNVNLVASKYSTLGAVEKSFLDFSKPNTSFQIVSFDSIDIAQGISLVDRNSIPRIAPNENDANNVFGLSMEASNSGWLTTGKTSFYTREPSVSGVTYYEGENSTVAPSMLFYLYHSKNISEEKDLGTVRISIQAITKINAISNEVKMLVINVNMSTALFQTVEYEGAMAPGDKYELFMSTSTNITSKSKYSAYYALYGAGENLYKPGYHRVLTSTFVFPENTKITMLDFVNGVPEYYYHVMTASDVTAAQADFQTNNNEQCAYALSMFTRMGSVSNSSNYDDASKNNIYYNGTDSSEEFIFIVDFSDTNINSDELDQKLLIEIRDSNEEDIVSVLGLQHSQLTYNVYVDKDSEINMTATPSDNPLYIGYNDIFDVSIDYQNSSLSGVAITDTQYFDSKMGVQIYIKNNEGHIVSGTDLTGSYFTIDGVRYYPDISGYTHIKLADKVGNTRKWITFNTENASLATGDYTFVFEAFASPDGIYYSSGKSDIKNVNLTIINSTYGLKPEINDESVIFSANNDKSLKFTVEYTSLLDNPNIRVAMYRRKYDTTYDTNYELVDLQDYCKYDLSTTNNPKEYLLINGPSATNGFTFPLNNELLTGTYRLSFRLYDGDTLIGDINRYIIVK